MFVHSGILMKVKQVDILHDSEAVYVARSTRYRLFHALFGSAKTSPDPPFAFKIPLIVLRWAVESIADQLAYQSLDPQSENDARHSAVRVEEVVSSI